MDVQAPERSSEGVGGGVLRVGDQKRTKVRHTLMQRVGGGIQEKHWGVRKRMGRCIRKKWAPRKSKGLVEACSRTLPCHSTGGYQI